MTELIERSGTPSRGRRLRLRARAMIAVPLAAAMLTVATPAADATENGHQIIHSPVTWQISGGAGCSQLPEGVVIDGSGTVTNRIISHTDAGGLTRVQGYSIATGTATESPGGRSYRWVYANHENVVNSAGDPFLFTGTMTDSFRLVGGPLAFTNGFDADVIDSLGNPPFIFEAHPTSVTGDPFTFPSGPGRCDPI